MYNGQKGGVLMIYSLTELRNMIITIIKRYKAEHAILFGSYARGEATVTSDIDLMIIGGTAFDPTDIFAIAEDLHQLSRKNVDVYEINEIDKASPLYESIVRDGIRLI